MLTIYLTLLLSMTNGNRKVMRWGPIMHGCEITCVLVMHIKAFLTFPKMFNINLFFSLFALIKTSGFFNTSIHHIFVHITYLWFRDCFFYFHLILLVMIYSFGLIIYFLQGSTVSEMFLTFLDQQIYIDYRNYSYHGRLQGIVM